MSILKSANVSSHLCFKLKRVVSCKIHSPQYEALSACYSSVGFYWGKLNFPPPVLDDTYICNLINKDEITLNINNRKGVGNIELVLKLYTEITNNIKDDATKVMLLREMLKIPNKTHPDVLKHGELPCTVKVLGDKNNISLKPKQFHEISNSMKLLKNDLSNVTGHRSYYFKDQLAQLEQALIKYSVSKLVKSGFQLMSVPDILHGSVIKRCGMEVEGSRSQVYCLSEASGKGYLSGTAELALAGYLMNKKFNSDQLPLRLAAVSRCYRAETSRTSDEKGIYRVHQFTKVEIFVVCSSSQSEELLEEVRIWQEQHFSSLGLCLRVLDMPACELGAQAYRKYDIEAWLPARHLWAEVSSCSDCSDFQTRRLLIREGDHFAHTVNGTACAIPRLLIALFETHQQKDGSVLIPHALLPFMKNQSIVNKLNTKHIPLLKPIKRQNLMS